MTAPLSSFSGIVSGFNYKDLVDEIIKLEGRPAQRSRDEVTRITGTLNALTTYRGLLDKLKSAATSFRDGSALEATTAVTSILSGAKALATVTTGPTAVPGSYTLEVTQLAQAEKLGGGVVADTAAAAGIAGTFTLNGVSITITATDSLVAIRDRINAANSGTTPSKVSATILTVGAADHRLVLSSTQSGAAGITLADTTGTALQALGFLDGAGAKIPAAILSQGRDALFAVDGIDFIRSTNSVTDALAGVTLSLTGAEVGAQTSISVDRYLDSGRTAAKGFVDAYNALVKFLKEQSTATATSRPGLYGDSMLRTARSGLPSRLLETVLGAAADLSTAASAGFSLKRDGTLSLDAVRFENAFRNRYDDLRALFMETRTATDPLVTLVSGGASTGGGTYAVDITAAATRASIQSSGFGGTYDAGATPDVVTFTDNGSGTSAQVTFNTGMTTADIVTALNAAFDASGLDITAEAAGAEVLLTHGAYGSAAGISVLNANAGDGASELWSSAATNYGINVQGTIGGHAATGAGQQLVANAGTPVAGMTVRFAGTAPGAAGTVGLTVGAGASVERLLDTFLQASTGSVAHRETSLRDRAEKLDARAAMLEARLENRRAALMRRFVNMESAVARLQQQSRSLAAMSGFQSASTK